MKPGIGYHISTNVWEMYHRERVEILERLGLDPTAKRPWNKE